MGGMTNGSVEKADHPTTVGTCQRRLDLESNTNSQPGAIELINNRVKSAPFTIQLRVIEFRTAVETRYCHLLYF